MATNNDDAGRPPAAATDAVLVQSAAVPEGTQKVEEIDFNAFKGRPITVDDMMAGMKYMGFQASSMGEAVRIINDMVSYTLHCGPGGCKGMKMTQNRKSGVLTGRTTESVERP